MLKMKPKLTAILLLLLLGLLAGFLIFKKNAPAQLKNQSNPTSAANTQNNPPEIVSTNPDPLEDNIVSSTQTIEIAFNRSLENVGEFKFRIEPKINIKIELSGDRKIARIIPIKPFELGTTYTIFIGPETKFDGIGNWGQEKIYHFRTIKYTGV